MDERAEDLKVIRESRKELLESVDKVRAERRKRRVNTPCIYFVSILQVPRTKENPSPQKAAKVQTFNVKGGHLQPRLVKNMLRRGQMPVSYDLPTPQQADDFAKGAAQNSRDGDLLKGEIASQLAGEDPYGKVRTELDNAIRMTLSDWQNEDLKEEVSELKKRAEEAESKSGKKKGGTNAKDKKEESGS